jgi:hypothetical protein
VAQAGGRPTTGDSAIIRAGAQAMTPQAQPDTRLRGPWVLLAQAAWIVLAVVTVALLGASIPLVFNELRTVAIGKGTSIWQLRPDEARALEQLGLTVGFYAIYWVVNLALFVLGFAIVAGVIFWRKSDDWLALFVSLFLLMFGANMVTAVPEPPTTPAVWYVAYKVIQDLVFISTPLFFFLVPDGRFVPRWTRPLAVGWIAFGLFKRLLPFTAPPGDVLILGLLGTGALAQIYRYRRVSNAVQRQQTKWVVFGFALTIVVFVGVQLPFVIFPWLRQPGAALYRLPALTVILFALLVLPVTIGLSILRYRLWDIDLLIRRTLVYSVLSGLLALTYFSSVIVSQSLLSAVGSPPSEFVTVLSTLAIAALFLPLRRRVQDVIDRRFYRKKYDAQKVIANFAATARDEADLEKLTARLVEVVQETMQPEKVTLWLKPTGDRSARPGGVAITTESTRDPTR